MGIKQKELAAALWIPPFSDVTIYLLRYKDKDEEPEHRDLMNYPRLEHLLNEEAWFLSEEA